VFRQTRPAAPCRSTGLAAILYRPGHAALIRLALENNRDLRVAALNIETRAQVPDPRQPVPIHQCQRQWYQSAVSANSSSTGSAYISHSYSAIGFSAYELDVFGRLSSLKQQALENYFSLEETRRSTQISLVAEVANAYLTLLADRQHLKVADETASRSRLRWNSPAASWKLGAATDLDLSSAETTVQSAQSAQASYQSQVAQDENALTLLLGTALPEDLRSSNAQLLQGSWQTCPPVCRLLAATPPGHSGRRARPESGGCQYRCCAGQVLPQHQPDGKCRSQLQQFVRAVQGR
jgi:multidrug efflux system outer membrane protein